MREWSNNTSEERIVRCFGCTDTHARTRTHDPTDMYLIYSFLRLPLSFARLVSTCRPAQSSWAVHQDYRINGRIPVDQTDRPVLMSCSLAADWFAQPTFSVLVFFFFFLWSVSRSRQLALDSNLSASCSPPPPLLFRFLPLHP